jgi:hypothetical protein
MPAMKRLFVTALVSSLALLVVLPGSAWAVQPRTGVFHGGIAGIDAGGDGWFKVKSTASGYKLVAVSTMIPEIVAPTDLECNVGAAYLPVNGIPVKAGGAFTWQGLVPTIGPSSTDVTVTFKGSFVTRRKATGTTRVVGDGCNSGAEPWTMTFEPA